MYNNDLFLQLWLNLYETWILNVLQTANFA